MPLQPSLMFVHQAGAYQSEANIDSAGKACQGQTLLLITVVNYGRKKFCNIGPWGR
jgi:hypothetical protein